jgi:hypothetical protein
MPPRHIRLIARVAVMSVNGSPDTRTRSARCLLRAGHQAGFAEHVENGGNAEGQRLRESAGHEVHVRVDQTGKHRPARRVVAAATASSPKGS